MSLAELRQTLEDFGTMNSHAGAMNEKPWSRVGRLIEERVVELGITWSALYERADISEPTVKAARQGRAIKRRDKIVALCRGLQWTDDSIDLILTGEEPVSLVPVSPDGQLPADRVSRH